MTNAKYFFQNKISYGSIIMIDITNYGKIEYNK